LSEGVEYEPRKAALVLARLGEHRHIRRQGAAVGKACRLLVRERRRKMIGRPARALEHFALVVGAVLDLVLGRDRLDLRLGEVWSTLFAKSAERHQVEAVTDLANLAIDLESALKLAGIIAAEHTVERPGIAGRLWLILLLRRGRRRRAEEKGGTGEQHGEARDHLLGPGYGLRNRGRQRLRLFEEAKQRQHDDEVEEIPRGQHAGRDHIAAFRGLRSEPAEANTDEDEDP